MKAIATMPVKLLWLFFILLISTATLKAAETKPLSPGEIDDLVAPIALYPDALVSHILPAATQPLQVVQAARLIKENDGNVKKVPDNDWEPSIKALLETPSVLTQMNEKLSWTVKLGDAVMAQQDDVLDGIQRVRKAAQAAGKLESNDKQIVIVEKEVIKIEPPKESSVVYVPTYYYVPSSHSTVVYSHHHADEAAFVGFTMGLLFGAIIADDHWHHHHHVDWYGHHIHHGWSDIDIDIDKDINIDLGDRDININKNDIKNRSQTQPWKPSQKAQKQFKARAGDRPKVQSEQLRSKISSRPKVSGTGKSISREGVKTKGQQYRQSSTRKSQRKTQGSASVFANTKSSGESARRFSERGKISRSGQTRSGGMRSGGVRSFRR